MALALPSNSKAQLERVSKDKPSCLLGLVVSDKEKKFNEEKKFYNTDLLHRFRDLPLLGLRVCRRHSDRNYLRRP
jgi:hypothetical protein